MSVLTMPGSTPVLLNYYLMRKFSVDEYHRMIQTGILTEDDPVELLEGWIVLKMPRNPPHYGVIEISEEILRGRLAPGWKVRVQSAITTDDSEPEPDLVVASGTSRSHLDHHPEPPEIALVIEVADSTLTRDRQDKGRLYARASIVCYWIINLVDRQIEIYTDPSGPGANPTYHRRQDYAVTDSVPLVIEGKEIARIAVSEFFP